MPVFCGACKSIAMKSKILYHPLVSKIPWKNKLLLNENDEPMSRTDLANALPSQVGYAIGIPAAIALHATNIAISMASPMIHSLRLNFVEFLPKFYAPEGRAFNPFKKETTS